MQKEGEENWSGDTLRANIPHKTHIKTDGQVFRVGEFTYSAFKTQR